MTSRFRGVKERAQKLPTSTSNPASSSREREIQHEPHFQRAPKGVADELEAPHFIAATFPDRLPVRPIDARGQAYALPLREGLAERNEVARQPALRHRAESPRDCAFDRFAQRDEAQLPRLIARETRPDVAGCGHGLGHREAQRVRVERQ